MACFLRETSPCLHLECDQCWQTKQALSSQIHRMYVATLRAIQVGIFCFQITLHVHVVSLRVLMRHVSVSVVGILEFCQLKTLCWIVCAIFRKHVIFLRRRSINQLLEEDVMLMQVRFRCNTTVIHGYRVSVKGMRIGTGKYLIRFLRTLLELYVTETRNNFTW